MGNVYPGAHFHDHSANLTYFAYASVLRPRQSSRDHEELPANMPSVAEYQQKYDEISEIRQAAKTDFSMSNAKKREIAEQFTAARNDLRAASRAAMASSQQSQPTADEAILNVSRSLDLSRH